LNVAQPQISDEAHPGSRKVDGGRMVPGIEAPQPDGMERRG